MIQRQEIQTGFARIIRELEAPICMAVFRIRARSTKDKIINIIIVIVIIIIIFVIIIEDKSSEELFFRIQSVVHPGLNFQDRSLQTIKKSGVVDGMTISLQSMG